MTGSLIVVLCCLAVLASAAPQFGFRPEVPSYCLQPPMVNTLVACNYSGRTSIKYYYDARTRDCERIMYSGCGGTQNLFRSKRECEARCENYNDNSFEIGDLFDIFDK